MTMTLNIQHSLFRAVSSPKSPKDDKRAAKGCVVNSNHMHLITGARDGTCKQFDLENGDRLLTWSEHLCHMLKTAAPV